MIKYGGRKGRFDIENISLAPAYAGASPHKVEMNFGRMVSGSWNLSN